MSKEVVLVKRSKSIFPSAPLGYFTTINSNSSNLLNARFLGGLVLYSMQGEG